MSFVSRHMLDPLECVNHHLALNWYDLNPIQISFERLFGLYLLIRLKPYLFRLFGKLSKHVRPYLFRLFEKLSKHVR